MAKKATNDEAEKEDLSDGTLAVNDAWTGMLIISFLALVTGAAFLGWDALQYGDVPKVPKVSGNVPGPPPVLNPPKADGDEKKDGDKKKDDGKKKDAGLWRDADRHAEITMTASSPQRRPRLFASGHDNILNRT